MTAHLTDNGRSRRNNAIFGKIMKIVVPMIVTVGLCVVMFSNIDFGEMLDVIRSECNFRWIALGMALSVVSHIVRAYRWKIQLKALNITPPAWVLVLSIFGTYAVNLVFPRLGEVWRSEYVSRRQHADFSTVFGSMVAERLADLLTAFLLLILAFFLASHTIVDYLTQDNGAYDRVMAILGAPWVWIAIILCCAGLWWLLTRQWPEGSFMAKIQGFLKGLWKGFASIAVMPGKGRWLLLTVALWGCYFIQLYVAFFAFPFTREALSNYGITVALVTFVLSSISMGVPSNGGIGPWQWAVIFGLGIYGVGSTDAAAFANMVLGCQTLTLIVLGIVTFVTIFLTRNNSSKEISTNNNIVK